MQADEPLRYSPKSRRVGRDAVTEASTFFHRYLTQEEYIRSKRLGFVSLVSHPPDYRQDHQKGVLLRPGGVWSGRECALPGSP